MTLLKSTFTKFLYSFAWSVNSTGGWRLYWPNILDLLDSHQPSIFKNFLSRRELIVNSGGKQSMIRIPIAYNDQIVYKN